MHDLLEFESYMAQMASLDLMAVFVQRMICKHCGLPWKEHIRHTMLLFWLRSVHLLSKQAAKFPDRFPFAAGKPTPPERR